MLFIELPATSSLPVCGGIELMKRLNHGSITMSKQLCAGRCELLLLIALPALSLLLIPAVAQSDEIPVTDALILLEEMEIGSVWTFIEEWSDEGAWLPHVYPPNLIIGSVPADLEEAIRRDSRVISLNRRPFHPARAEKTTDRHSLVIASWNKEGDRPVHEEEARKSWAETGESCELKILDKSAWELPRDKMNAIAEKQYGRARGADFLQTSEWVIGRTVVGVVLPSAAGARHSASEKIQVIKDVRGAFSFLSSKAGAYPGARFAYDIHDSVEISRNLGISPPSYREEEWTSELMMNLGGYDMYVKGTHLGPVYEYLDNIRTQFSTEWAISLFLPKAVSFRGVGYTAYAYLGGPFLVAPSGTDDGRTGASNMLLSHLIIHEASHLYYALDEYRQGGTSTPCRAVSGYMAVFNRNSALSDFMCERPRQLCGMETPGPYLCSYSLGMMGAADTDVNEAGQAAPDGIPDVLDTTPWVYLDSTLSDTVTTIYPEITGWAAVVPKSNQAHWSGTGAMDGDFDEAAVPGDAKRNNISFNTIEHVIYQIDDRSWRYGDPEGGWEGDSGLVHFRFRPDSLSGGEHTITVKGVNDVQNESTGGFAKSVTLFVKAIALHNFNIQPDFKGKLRITFNIFGGAFHSEAILYRISAQSTGGEEQVPEVVQVIELEDDTHYEIFDDEGLPGEEITYRLVIRGLGLEWDWDRKFVKPSPIERGEFLSIATPNPFRDQTVISFRVPRGPRDERYSGGNKPGDNSGDPGDYRPPTDYAPADLMDQSEFIPLSAEINIYNVAGRRVRHYPPASFYEGFAPDPVVWDGKDNKGNEVPQGIYFARLTVGDDVRETRKIVLLR